MAGITLLFSEVLDKVHKAKTKDQKVKILREHNSPALRSVLKSSFDPNIKWVLPEGDVPYTKNDAPAGTEHTTLASESRKLWHFIKGGDGETPQWKKEQMFVQMLEGLHEDDADVLVAAKDKSLHRKFKGLSDNVVKEAFNWTDEYMLDEGEKVVYPQAPGLASGPG